MSSYQFKFPELYQFFGGYFYQGWASDYRWESANASFAAVVRHFRAVNPPLTVGRVRNELESLLALALDDSALGQALAELGSNFYAPAEGLNNRQWLEKILDVLQESSTKAQILRELR